MTQEERRDAIIKLYRGGDPDPTTEDNKMMISRTIIMKNAHLLHDPAMSREDIKQKVTEDIERSASEIGCSINVTFSE